MIGLVGILGCITIAAVVVAAVAAVVSTAYSVYNADATSDEMDAQNAKNEERMAVQEALAERQNKRALLKAAQMAATGSLMDRIMASNLEHKAENERRKMHRVGTPQGAIPRPERNFGTVSRSDTTIKI